jgi:hypothetical protein
MQTKQFDRKPVLFAGKARGVAKRPAGYKIRL